MRAGPMACRVSACRQRHFQSFSGVETRASDFGEVPIRTQIASPHFSACFKPAAGQNDGFGADFHRFALNVAIDAIYTSRNFPQCVCGCIANDFNSGSGRGFVICIQQPWPAAPHFKRQTAPKFESSVNFCGLPAKADLKTDAEITHPRQRIKTIVDEYFDEIGIAPVMRKPHHIFQVIFARIYPKIRRGDFAFSQIRNQSSHVGDALINRPHLASGVTCIAALILSAGSFQDQNRCTRLLSRECSRHRRVPRSDDDDIIVILHYQTPSCAAASKKIV